MRSGRGVLVGEDLDVSPAVRSSIAMCTLSHPTVRRSTPAAPRLRFVVLMGGETGARRPAPRRWARSFLTSMWVSSPARATLVARRWPNAEAASLLYPRDPSLIPGVIAWRLSLQESLDGPAYRRNNVLRICI
jgi:hypothetical protein